MFADAASFNQDLCAWSSTIEAETLSQMFAGTDCPEGSSTPSLMFDDGSEFSFYTPMCYPCSAPTAQPTSAPSGAPSGSPSAVPSMAPTFKVFETREELRDVLRGDPCPDDDPECDATFSKYLKAPCALRKLQPD